MHQRRQFLENIKTQLEMLPNFGSIMIQRILPARNAWPAITLFADQESVQTESIHPSPRPQDRALTISVVIWIKGGADDEKAEKDMDKYAAAVETALLKPIGADDMALVATDFVVDEEEAEIHAVTLTYSLLYNTLENNPNV